MFMAGVFVVGAILSYISCKAALRLATHAGMIVQPGERQSHQVATPTGGGLGLVFSLVLTTVGVELFSPLPEFWWLHVMPGVVLLALTGWFDDKRHVSSMVRLLIQLVVSLWLLGFVCLQKSVGSIAMCAGIMGAMIWLMNLYNFMDGSDGMAGFQGVFAGLVMAVLFFIGDELPMAALSVAVAAACVGFLPVNFPKARIFMGDVASVPLGFIFASMAVYGLYSGVISLPVSVLIMSVFIIDASLTLIARVFAGERWYTAHNQHVYQRLISRGWSHSRVLKLYQFINVILVLPAIVLAAMYTQYANLTAGLTLLLLGACWFAANRKLGMRAARRLV
jgi:UDP-N-acetylmuramyl pentapeptide phosphotransferase/UDP-N-acetylglucosamine-1-phosphate transferase